MRQTLAIAAILALAALTGCGAPPVPDEAAYLDGLDDAGISGDQDALLAEGWEICEAAAQAGEDPAYFVGSTAAWRTLADEADGERYLALGKLAALHLCVEEPTE